MDVSSRTIKLLLLLLLLSALGYAQDGDYQLRVLAHTQVVPKDKKVGFAAWAVFPNTLNDLSQRRLLLAGGVYKTGKRWVEVLAGGILSKNEPPSFVLDLRYSERYKRANTFLELLYNFRTRSLLINPAVTTPVRYKKFRASVGGEADFNFAPSSKNWIIGPRLVVPLPVCRHVCKDFSVVTAYRFHGDGRRVVRNYVIFNF